MEPLELTIDRLISDGLLDEIDCCTMTLGCKPRTFFSKESFEFVEAIVESICEEYQTACEGTLRVSSFFFYRITARDGSRVG